MGVGIVPLDDPARAIEELDFALELGMQAIWVPHRSPIGHAPGHVDLEPFWARLAESGTPFVLHVGGSPLQALDSWSNNGRAAVKDWMGGGENVRTKDAALLHQPPETFVSMLLLDGVFERHPGLRGAAVELGAGWVPELLRRLDWVTRTYSRVDESVRFERPPSEQLTQQMGFTPFPDRGRRRADRTIESGPLPVQQRLSPRGGRPRPDRQIRKASGGGNGRREGPFLQRKLFAAVAARTGLTRGGEACLTY